MTTETQEKTDKFTAEQRAAIASEGKTIVSASAGSGKTTVMIEKIIRLIQSGCNVNEILAVTFTKKAASQMKEKLRKALIQTINDKNTTPERRAALKKQLDEVPSADISTIHSFCSKLIRSHFYAADVDNTFRVIGGDDAEGTAMKNAAIDELFEEGYEEQDEAFLHLLSVYWRKKSDNNFRKILLTAYGELRDRADYKVYLENSGKYDEETFDKVCADLFTILKDKCRYYVEFIKEERAFFTETGGNAQIALTAELYNVLDAVLTARDYFDACTIQKPKFSVQRSSKKDSEEKRAHMERLAAIKGKIVKIFDDELSQTLSREDELKNFLNAGKTAAALAKYLLRFDEKYEEKKRERGVLDYNDLEHKTLSLLQDQEIAKEIKEKYRYVFVDEYQDVNPVQEALISRISGENLFLVGDVKQSIYGFRGSKSKFFLEKQKQFSQLGASLMMKRNFRSADAVLDAVNSQFSLAMTTVSCGVDYAGTSYMERGGRYALNDGKVQIHFLGEEEKKKAEARGVYSVKANANKREIEDRISAKTIHAIIQNELASKWYDADAGEYRQVRYSDIAILSRKKQGQIAKTVAALAAEGVPVTAAAAVNICEFSEIKTLIDILSLLDNAEQDVPLCSALLSSMGNLTADDLTEIRLAYKEEKFFRNACKRYAQENNELAYKLKRFYRYFEEMRDLSRIMDAGELLSKIIAETRMEARLLSRENGAACLRRIHRFIEETSADEPLCVHAFLRRLRDLDYKIEYSENGGEDSVKVLTMHSSKGLEYPVVILDDLSALFKTGDRDEALVEEKYGIAPRAYDTEKMTKADTLLRRLHTHREAESSIADELNLYYVALTRAKYSLHLLFKKPSVVTDVRYARSFADFTNFDVWKKYFVFDGIFDVPKQARMAAAFDPDEELAREIMQSFLWKYPHTGYENLPVKSSATLLMKGGEETPWETGLTAFGKETEYQGTLFDAENEDGTLIKTSKEAGIAYHAFLERFDFSSLYERDGTPVNQERIAELVEEAYRQAEEENAIEDIRLLSKEKLTEILSNAVFQELRGMTLYKEQQFLVSLPVSEAYALKKDAPPSLLNGERDEEMIFQGAIDLLAVGEEEVRIIDYKYSQKSAKELKEHYAPQLALYRLAVSKIMDVPQEKIRCTIVNIYRGFQVD